MHETSESVPVRSRPTCLLPYTFFTNNVHVQENGYLDRDVI